VSEYREVALAKSRKGKDKKPELHHIRIFASEDATPEKPSWLVAHHFTDRQDEPQVHKFDDHNEMLQHVAEYTSTELDEI
jgi:hypothetical protein